MWLDWLFVCDCGFSLSALWCPLSVPTVLLGFLLPWTWGISSRLLQQSTATAPYLGHAVAPLCCAWDAVSFGFTLYVITIRVSNQDYVSFLTLVRKIFKFKRNLNSKDIFFFKIWTNLPEKWSLGAAAFCWSNREEIPHIQGNRNPSKTVGTERGHQRAERLKPQSQKINQSNHMDHSLVELNETMSHAV